MRSIGRAGCTSLGVAGLVDRSGAEERALVGVTMLGLAVGIATSLTAAAADAQTLPLVFPLTVQSLAIGVTTTLMLPFLRFSPDSRGAQGA